MDPSMGGPNSSPMGIVPGDQDPSMPLPPGGMNPGGGPPGSGPNGGFSKNSPIMGVPTTNDPNYAQQYHNFPGNNDSGAWRTSSAFPCILR